MQDLTYVVTYCGLYCKLCDNLGRVPQQATSLHTTLKKGGWEHFGPHIMPGFKEFWARLEQLRQVDPNFEGCRGGKCGNPECNIRKCAQNRQVKLCSSCENYPCKHIYELAERYPNLIGEGRRQQKVGLEQWIREQEERCITGFCYCDIRYDA